MHVIVYAVIISIKMKSLSHLLEERKVTTYLIVLLIRLGDTLSYPLTKQSSLYYKVSYHMS